MSDSNIAQRLVSYAIPGVFLLTSVVCHIQTAVFHPISLLSNVSSYREKAFASLWSIGGIICARDTPLPLGPILAESRGVILDVGPGAGHQLFRFTNPGDITAIYGAEPGVSMHGALRARAKSAGLGEKYQILPCEAKLESLLPTLADAGAADIKFDEIVCIRVLCGVADPGEVINGLYSLLKPGGKMIVCEHVLNSGDSKQGGTGVGRALQKTYMHMGWSPMMGGCELTRDTMSLLQQAATKDGGWEDSNVQLCDPYSTIPHIVGTLRKRRDVR